MITKLSPKIFRLFPKSTNQRRAGKLPQVLALISKQPVLISSLAITGLLLGFSELEGLQPLELVVFDQMLRLKPQEELDPQILVVTITEADIQAQKQWPLSDRTLANLLAQLQSYQPKVIGLDMYRDLAHPPGHAELLKQLQAPNTIAIAKLSDTEGADVPPPPGVPQERIGFNDLLLDPDGVIRRNLIYARTKTEEFYSFSLRVSLAYLKDRKIGLKVNANDLQVGKAAFPALEANSGGYQNINAQGYQVLLNYRGKNVAPQVTLTEVLNGEVNAAWVKDKVVLIGTTAPSAKDLFFTPYNAGDRQQTYMPGVLVHTHMVSQILSKVLEDRPLFWFWPQWAEALWVWGWSLLGGVLIWRIRHPISLGFAVSIALGGLFGICFLLFAQAGWIPFVAPAFALIATGSSVGVYKLFHHTFYDTLTSLPNRTLFLKRVQQAIAQNDPSHRFLAVLVLDLDRFQLVNESLGHSIGDQLLCAVSQRLKASLQPTDTLARLGGDEFAILLNTHNDTDRAIRVAEQIQKELASPFHLKGHEIFTTVSLGITFNQEGQKCPDDLLRDAHTAMYRAKSLGKARYEVFSPVMHTHIVTRVQLEQELRRAINGVTQGTSQEFVLYYQPIVLLNTRRIAGFEALIRWHTPEGKFISPADFIPLTEETGLIVPLGEWILKEACRQLQIWQTQFPMQPPLMMSINLSGQQFSQPDLTEKIEQILKQTGLEGENLKLEITESMAMTDVESTIAKILRLKALNLRFSIDDFGTGYSSLSYLHRFPVDTLKVDRSFVSRMEETNENAAIVQTIVILGHSLGMNLVAEGVETESQMEKLRELQCEYGQGYFFSKPLSSEAATALLATQTQL